MNYTIELYDTWGRRIGVIDDVPLIEAVRTAPDGRDRVRGLLPIRVTDLSIGYRVRVLVDGRLFCEAAVTEVSPEWSDTRKLILDRYVNVHEVVEFLAETPDRPGNTNVTRAYTNREISTIVKDALQRAPGSIHYTVAHTAYPNGAEREFNKFAARMNDDNELEIGGIAEGQWVGSDRIDATGAFAKDGDTIAGLKVDGEDWPDLRLMMIDSEETTRNSHAISRHPEVAFWTNDEYNASGYKRAADRATAALQALIDDHGIDFIELNPHLNSAGEFDDRVDAFGRYLGLVFGGGLCFNAAQVELGVADVFLFDEGKFLVPELELKDFFSYTGAHEDSTESTARVLSSFDVNAGVLEALTTLGYAAGGYIWTVGPDLAVSFRKSEQPDRVFYFNPLILGVQLGSTKAGLTNAIVFEGNPVSSTLTKTYTRQASIDEYGFLPRGLDHFGLSTESDADQLAEGLLDDLAYPTPDGVLTFYRGTADATVGDIVEVRGGPIFRLEREVAGEWADQFTVKLVGRVREVRHRFTGRQVETQLRLTSPLRTVDNPLAFMVRTQPGETVLYQFRLDDEAVGADLGYHLD